MSSPTCAPCASSRPAPAAPKATGAFAGFDDTAQRRSSKPQYSRLWLRINAYTPKPAWRLTLGIYIARMPSGL